MDRQYLNPTNQRQLAYAKFRHQQMFPYDPMFNPPTHPKCRGYSVRTGMYTWPGQNCYNGYNHSMDYVADLGHFNGDVYSGNL